MQCHQLVIHLVFLGYQDQYPTYKAGKCHVLADWGDFPGRVGGTSIFFCRYAPLGPNFLTCGEGHFAYNRDPERRKITEIGPIGKEICSVDP